MVIGVDLYPQNAGPQSKNNPAERKPLRRKGSQNALKPAFHAVAMSISRVSLTGCAVVSGVGYRKVDPAFGGAENSMHVHRNSAATPSRNGAVRAQIDAPDPRRQTEILRARSSTRMLAGHYRGARSCVLISGSRSRIPLRHLCSWVA